MNITKDQIQHLTAEQQETLASIELQRAKKRQRLLDQMGHSPAMRRMPVVFPVIAAGLVWGSMFLGGQKYAPSFLIGGAMIVCILIEIQVAHTNRRLDALIELLEADKKEGD
jgi:hypothetical protein